MNILRIDASARIHQSVSRELADELIERLRQTHGELHLTQRELSEGIPLLDESWIGANFTAPEARSAEQRGALALSDALIEELKGADAIVLATPIYNFGVPAVLKAWVDQIARARVTFRYSENGPVGLLPDRPVYLVIASGGTAVDSEIDFAGRYLRHIFNFIGLQDLHLIAADRLMVDADASMARARGHIDGAGVPALAA